MPGEETQMNSKRRLLPSPGTAMGVLALVVALAGVAIADPGAETSKKAPTTKQVKKIATSIADQRIAAKAPSLSVANAVNATNAANATTAASANPVAFARVADDGDIDATRSKGMGSADVDNPAAGIYCIYDLPFEFKGAQVTTDFDDSTAQIATQFGSVNPATCTPAADAYVSTVASNDLGADAGFYIVFYN
jgi:hypothetical protein